MQNTHRRLITRKRAIGLGLVLVLLVAMVWNTKFLTPAELAAALPKPFDAKATAADLFAKGKTELPASASPLAEVVTAIQADPKAAAARFNAVEPTANSYAFPVDATATVSEASADTLRLTVDGVPDQTQILVPLTTAVNGTALRDVMGFKFADAPGQTEYQYVGDELKKLIQSEVSSTVKDPASLQGKKVTVLGVITLQSTGAPPPKAKPVSVQPLTMKAG
jgi:predicted lipoprotein